MSLVSPLPSRFRSHPEPRARAMAGEPSPGDAVAIIGLGYVGLPLAVALARGQQRTGGSGSIVGFDINPRRIELLRQGHDHTGEVETEALRSAKIHYSADPSELQDKDIYI